MAIDPLNPYGTEDPFLAFMRSSIVEAPPDPLLALAKSPTPTAEEVPVGALPPAPEPAPAQPAPVPLPELVDPGAWNPPVPPPAELGAEPPPVDAISGAAPLPPQEESVPGFFGDLAGLSKEVALDADPLKDTSDAGAAARLDAMAKTDPAAYAQYKAQHEATLANEAAAERARRSKELRDRVERETTAYEQAALEAKRKSEQVVAEAEQLSKQKLDRNRWWANKSTGGRIAAFAQAIIGGLVAGRTGGANEGMKMLMHEMDQDLEAQKFDLQQRGTELGRKQTAVGQVFARTQDLFQAQSAARLAALKGLDDEIATYASGLDPRGAAMFRAQDMRNQVRAQMAAEAQKYAKDEAQRRKDEAKQKLDLLEFDEKRREAKARESLGWAGIAEQRERRKLDEKKSDRDFKLDERKENRQDQELQFKRDELAQKRHDAVAKEDRELGIGGVTKVEMVDGEVVDPATNAKKPGKVPKVTTGQLRKADGSVFHASDEKEAQALRKARDGTQNLYDILGQVAKLRDKTGGANKFTEQADQAEYNRLVNSAVIALNQAKGISIADKQSFELARDAMFGGDPSSYNTTDVIGRIERSLSEATGAYHTMLKSRGYDGVLPRFEAVAPDAKNTTQEDVTKGILTDREPADKLRLTDEQNEGLATLRGQARSTDPAERDRARVELVNLAASRRSVSGPVAKYLQTEFPDLLEAAAARVKDSDPEWHIYLQNLVQQGKLDPRRQGAQ